VSFLLLLLWIFTAVALLPSSGFISPLTKSANILQKKKKEKKKEKEANNHFIPSTPHPVHTPIND